MKSELSSHAAVREPTQKRSVERVNGILEAAKTLISERGSAGLKVQDIADRAGITAGSMYQYFPNKAAIIQALGQRYLDSTADMIARRLDPPPRDWVAMLSLIDSVFDEYYDLHRSDPVIRDIWMGLHADKTLQAMDDADSRRNAHAVFTTCKHLFAEDKAADAERTILLIAHLTNTAVRVALDQDEDEAAETVRLFKQMIAAALNAYVQQSDSGLDGSNKLSKNAAR